MTLSAILIGCLLLLLLASGFTWLMILNSGRSLGALLPTAVRNPVPWNLFDLWLGLVLMLSCQAVAFYATHSYLKAPQELSSDELTPDQQATKVLAGSLGILATACLLLIYLVLVRRAGPRDFGWDRRRFFADLTLGGLAFVILIGPVLLLQIVLTRIWPSEHPIIELMQNSQSNFPIGACIFSAVMVAPVVEEFLFRVVLQGWFEKLAAQPVPQPLVLHAEPSSSEVDTPIARWPVVASAVIFSLAHFGHGPDMAALFVLACGLGFLYRQTHRVLPGIVVHFLLNAWSMFALLVSVNEKS